MDACWQPHCKTMQKLPSDYQMEYQDVCITATDGVKLAGWYIPAKDKGSKKLAIVAHCTTLYMNKSGCRYHRILALGLAPAAMLAVDHVKLYKVLHDAGYHVLTWDMRNHGHSEKRLPSAWGALEYKDHVGAMDWIAAHPDLKDCGIAYLPLCVGGSSYLIANSKHPDKFKNVKAVAVTNLVSIGIAVADRPLMTGMGSTILLDKALASKAKKYKKKGLLAEDFTITAKDLSADTYGADVKVPVLHCSPKFDIGDYQQKSQPHIFKSFGAGSPVAQKNEFHFIGTDQPPPFKTATNNRCEGYNYYGDRGAKVMLDFFAKHM